MDGTTKILALPILLICAILIGTSIGTQASAQVCVSNDPNDIDGDSIPNDWE
jgi:hypothetical protein